MSGKGKRKDKPKSKPHEVEFNNRCINLKRFAYEVIKFTALRFRVPESCIAVWDGKSNDYGKDDFLLAVCLHIIEYQISYRNRYHVYFRQHYEQNKLATPEFVCAVLFEAINKEIRRLPTTAIGIMDVSLSIACELYLFLYSKNIDLNLKKLSTAWFDCTKPYKKKFEKVQGLKIMYNKACEDKLDTKEAFLKKFIEAHCLPYHDTANNTSLGKRFYISNCVFRNSVKSLSRKGTGEDQTKFTRLDDLSDLLASLNISDEPPEPDGATGFKLPESPGLESTPLQQAIQYCGSLVTSSQDLPLKSPEEQLRHLLNLTQEERTKKIRSRMRSNKEQEIRRLTLDSSETEQSSDQTPSVPIATGPKSYENQGVRPKDRVQHSGSSDMQMEPFKQGYRQSTLVSSGKQSSDRKVSIAKAAAQSYEHQRARHKDRIQDTGSSELQTGESSGKSVDETVE